MNKRGIFNSEVHANIEYTEWCAKIKRAPTVLFQKSDYSILSLAHQGIDPAGVSPISQLLIWFGFVTEIDLSRNLLGDNGSQRECNLTQLGTAILFQALQWNKSVKKVFIKANKIGAEGASQIARTLNANATLTTLHLGMNPIGKSASLIIETLSNNTTLTEV